MNKPSHTSGFLTLIADAKSRIKEVTVDDVLAKKTSGEPFHFIDVREESEWKDGHAEGALYLGKGIMERDIEKAIPDKNAEIILYCGGGFRSVLAADNLQKMGYTRVASMDGGMRIWRERGLCVQK